jgi:Na+/H+ antiporter NhaA
MAIPVLIYLLVNTGQPSVGGWGIVMATDTAFALGVLALVAGGFNAVVRTFLLTVVIVDDMIALSVIALVYTEEVSLLALGAAAGFFLVVLAMRRAGVSNGVAYFLVGSALWLATLVSGVHATIAGVLMGVLASAYPPSQSDLQRTSALWRMFREQPTPEYARTASRSLLTTISPNERLQHLFHPWVSYAIVPLFALANAGVVIDAGTLGEAIGSPVTIGVVLGLVVGKPVGVILFSWLATRRWLGRLPLSVPWPALIGAAVVAGIGFTVSLLIADLSFGGDDLRNAKLGIIAASALASGLSWLAFRWLRRVPTRVSDRTIRQRPPLDLTDPVDPEVDHIRGPADARLTLIEYGDFQCPYCGRAEAVTRDLLQAFGDDLAFVFRHLPLSDVHEHAEQASEAAEAAGVQGRFWEMHDRLLAHQGSLELEDLVGHAAELGLDVGRFTDDLMSRRFSMRVARDVESADESGVAGTPTFFINGRRHYGAYDIDSLTEALQREADAARS